MSVHPLLPWQRFVMASILAGVGAIFFAECEDIGTGFERYRQPAIASDSSPSTYVV